MSYQEDDYRPAFVFDDVKKINLVDVRIPTVKDLPVIFLNNAVDVIMKGLKMPVTEDKGIQRANNK